MEMEMEEPILKDALDDVVQQLADIFGLQSIMPYYKEIKTYVEAGLEIAQIVAEIALLLA